MKKDRLIDAIGHIDDELLRETDDIRKQYFNVGSKRKKRRNNILSILAACILLVLLVGIGMLVQDESEDSDNVITIERSDYSQKVEIRITSWNSEGCAGVITNTYSHDVFKESDEVLVRLEETEVLFKNGTTKEYSFNELNADGSEVQIGSVIEVEFYTFESMSLGGEANKIYAEVIREK